MRIQCTGGDKANSPGKRSWWCKGAVKKHKCTATVAHQSRTTVQDQLHEKLLVILVGLIQGKPPPFATSQDCAPVQKQPRQIPLPTLSYAYLPLLDSLLRSTLPWALVRAQSSFLGNSLRLTSLSLQPVKAVNSVAAPSLDTADTSCLIVDIRDAVSCLRVPASFKASSRSSSSAFWEMTVRRDSILFMKSSYIARAAGGMDDKLEV